MGLMPPPEKEVLSQGKEDSLGGMYLLCPKTHPQSIHPLNATTLVQATVTVAFSVGSLRPHGNQ